MSKVVLEGSITDSIFIDCDFFETELVGLQIQQSIFAKCDLSATIIKQCNIDNTEFLLNKNFNPDCIGRNTKSNVTWIHPS